MGKVRIYGTIGPACKDKEILKQMFHEGMDGVRLNLSHSSLEESSALIDSLHNAARECGVSPELLIDMHGPELRIGYLKAPIELAEGSRVGLGDIPFPDIVKKALTASDPGQEVLLDDGKILLRKEGEALPLRTQGEPDAEGTQLLQLLVVRGGLLESRKSVALPGPSFQTPAKTETEREQLRRAKENGVTAVMQPFVRSRDDLIAVRAALSDAGCENIRLLAKIENRDGVRNLPELIPYCDEIVIARGDLGNAMDDLWELPAVQKHISAVCREAGRDFMVVTQMLDSMMHRQVPTRAEVSDIFNAVADGASSVMVTGETAAGDYPALAIRYLSRTAHEAERFTG